MNVYDRVLPNEAIATLWVLAIGIGVAFAFDFLLKFARANLIDYTGRKIDLKIAYILFQKIMNTSLSARSMSTGEYVSRVSQYEFVRDFFTSNTIATMIDTCFVFIFLGVIYAIAGVLALVPAVALIAVIIIGLVAQTLISRRVAAAANEAALRQSMLVETIYTTETVKGLRAEGILLKRWRDLTINSSATNEQIKSVSALAVNATQFVQQLVTVGIILVGAYLFSGRPRHHRRHHRLGDPGRTCGQPARPAGDDACALPPGDDVAAHSRPDHGAAGGHAGNHRLRQPGHQAWRHRFRERPFPLSPGRSGCAGRAVILDPGRRESRDHRPYRIGQDHHRPADVAALQAA